MQGEALAHLDPLLPQDLVLWTDSSFPFGKGGSGIRLADQTTLWDRRN